MSIKLERIQSSFVEEISIILNQETRDEDFKYVTITSCHISSDLSYAKVYFTCLNDKKKEEITKSLNNASGFIKNKLCEKVDIRKMPELTFIYDESIEYGNKIEQIIEEIHNKEGKNE